MMYLKSAAALTLVAMVSACATVPANKGVDRNFGDGPKSQQDLSNLTAGIWIDPQGCEHWIIDDGVEGYADLRRTPDGKPVCNSEYPRNTAIGPFKEGSTFGDFF